MDYFASFVMTAIRWIASATPRKDGKGESVIARLCSVYIKVGFRLSLRDSATQNRGNL